MSNISKEQIREHIINIVKNENEFFADRHLIEDYKNKISNCREYDELDYIAKIFIDDMERHLLNIEKNNFNIMKLDLKKLIDYLEFSNNNPFYEYLVEAVENKIYTPFACSKNINQILNLNVLISAIVIDLHIYNLVKEAETMNISKKRDSKKIKNAIDTLLLYTNDEQVKHYLKTIKLPTRDITVSTILSCIFCNMYKICENLFSYTMNKSEILSLSKDIMQNVFDSNKDYRPYSEIEMIKYKGYKLRMFKATKQKSN